VLQERTGSGKVLWYLESVLHCTPVCSRVLQCVAVCCSVLQCVAVCCRKELAVEKYSGILKVCCTALQCVAVCCSALQERISRGEVL